MTAKHPVVVITGASSGIGRATVLEFAAKGARVVLVSRSAANLRGVVEECEAMGAEAMAVAADVSDFAAVRSAATVAKQRFGRIDVWVNDASIGTFGTLLETDLDDFRRVIDVNVMGYVYGCRAALEVMSEQGEGAIVNVASIAGAVPQPFFASYGMSKAAVRALSVSLRSELALSGLRRIHVSTVSPATIDTPFFGHAGNSTGRRLRAMPPVYPPEKVARAIVAASVKHPAETIVGALGRSFMRSHRLTPGMTEGLMALMVDLGQLSLRQSTPNTSGILYASATDGAVTGGWGGARKARRRKLLALAGLAAGVMLVHRLTRSRET